MSMNDEARPTSDLPDFLNLTMLANNVDKVFLGIVQKPFFNPMEHQTWKRKGRVSGVINVCKF